MKSIIFEELKAELRKAVDEKGHPFRYFTLGTVGLDNTARLRTVVLRNISDDIVLTIYTDKRSKKITHIKENKKVCLLFYHSEKLIQLKIDGIAKINNEEESKSRIWNSIHPDAKKAYVSNQAPGTTITDPNGIEYLSNEDFFCLVEISCFKIEYLKLQSPHHLRVRFSKTQDIWESEFLVP